MQHWVKGLAVAVALFCLVTVAACGATPTRPQLPGFIFPKSSDVVHKVALDALVVNGFEIQKTEPLYVEGYRARRVGIIIGSGGETAGVWLEPIDNSRTRVQVRTARTFLGGAGQRNWDRDIIEEMEKVLGKRE